MGQSPLAFVALNFAKKILPGQLGQQSDLWMSQRHGGYYTSVYGTPAVGTTPAKAGSVFNGANQVTTPITALVNPTYTGLCLSNPIGSGVNLAVRRLAGLVTSAPSGQLGLGFLVGWYAAGITVHTTPLNTSIVNKSVGAGASGTVPVAGPAPLANLDAACTLVGTPTVVKWVAANGASGACVGFSLDTQDIDLIPPGGYLALCASAANGGFLGSIAWEEVAP